MTAYIIRRLLLIIPTFVIVTITVFLLVRFIPGNLIDIMLSEMGETGGVGAEQEFDRAALERRLGLDEPIHVSYLRWFGALPNLDGNFSGLIQGDLGDSLWKGTPVIREILPRLPVSLELGFMAIIMGLVVSLPVGIYAAIRQDTIGDYAGRSFAILSMSVPNFWVAIMVMVFPPIWWGWAPRIQYIPFGQDPLGNLVQFAIPAAVLAMALAGGTMRMTRTMMLEVLRQDYIRTAWAKGLRERVVVVRHALKNALIPVVTGVGMQIPLLVSGAVIIENIFALPGLGRLLMNALQRRDYSIVSGVNVLIAVFIMVNNLIVDLTYGFLDPRVRYN